ncbi:protein phosphatase 1 regulatory subunit 37 homolog [Neodiprion fabricii]|uniref:protein phosphatase 1 regulatory subunit 37 homolog n=1 Tax=Neodiprion fabricii TaxID=2872261 RepID=UPI001ED919A3|nr:protein phosphatase 1 regulatory subunit 37 homolog [Neodiprion fabricii]
MLEDLKYNETLQLLDLCNNNIGDHGMEHLGNWLKMKPSLSGLWLAHNIITSQGARALSLGMPFSKIRMLDLSYNRITDDGAVDILDSIKKSTRLWYLRIFGNSLGHCTAKIVERMLVSGVLVQENIDVKPYRVDHESYLAHYPSDHYKQRYYDVPCYSHPQPLQIPYVKNKFSGKAVPKVHFKYVDPVPIEDRKYPVLVDQNNFYILFILSLCCP